MADEILLTDLAGYVVAAEGTGTLGAIQQFGNFRNATNPNAPDQPTFEQSAQLGYTDDGLFAFTGADVSAGQQVIFDLALSAVYGPYATNVRVP